MSRDVQPTAPGLPRRVLLCAGALLSLGLAAACSDQMLAPEAELPVPTPAAANRVDCVADVRAGTVDCGEPGSAGGARKAIIGGQGVHVRLASTQGGYDAGTEIYTINVTVQNLRNQAMGTLDSLALHPDGVRVYFATGPNATEGTGIVDVANETGTDLFMGSNQPFFQYNEILSKDEVSPALPWQFKVPATVTRFGFSVYVQAAMEQKLVVTEVMPNPAAADDADGEYFEVYNPGLDPVNLKGWKITSNGGSWNVEKTTGHTIATDVIVPARGYAVLGRNTNPEFNGGLNVAYSFGATIQLASNVNEYVALRNTAGLLRDSVFISNVNIPNGRSRELLDVNADNTVVNSAAWNTAYARFGTGDGNGNFDRGTPGAANSPAVPVGPLARVEISPAFAVIDTLRQFRRFTAVTEDTLGQPVAATVTWTTTNPAIATIDGTGLVTQADTGTVSFIATAGAKADTVVYRVFQYSPASIYRNHVAFGVPTAGGGNDDLLILSDRRTQYALSYNASRGGPNWVSWNLNRTHFGKVARSPNFFTDPVLATHGVYQVTNCDYIGTGYTRGHMTQSEQRTQTRAENDTTFLMSNILPQLNELNSGPWGDLEEYTNLLVRFSQKEIYNVAGGLYPASPEFLVPNATSCTANANKVAIPTSTWKIAVVLPYGKGLADVTSAADLQIIVVNMPNTAGVGSQRWTAYTTTVDALEAATGYDFLSALPDAIEAEVEARMGATTIN